MTSRFKTLALLGLCLGLTVAGCGRKGSLDDPGAPVTPENAAVDPAVVEQTLPPAEPQSDKPFFLDFLIQ